MRITGLALVVLVGALLAGSGVAVAQPGLAQPGLAQPGLAQPGPAQPGLARPAVVAGMAAAVPGARVPGQQLAAVPTPVQSVATAASHASANGVTEYISVINRGNGAAVGRTANAGSQVASESMFKLMLASYYLVIAGGYRNMSAPSLNQLSFMLRFSDDGTANALFSSSAIPTIAARYGMGSTVNATDRAGHWGAARITAADMTTFLYRASVDAQVGPWLIPVMSQTAPNGSDGFNQHFGLNALAGVHGSKQGWGGDSFWTAAPNAINSVGYTDRYFVAILQLSFSYPDPARATSTFAAGTIAASRTPVVPAPVTVHNGDFVERAGSTAIFRVAGGAPVWVSSWQPSGGPHPVKILSTAQWSRLRIYPADGTFLTGVRNGEVYRVAGGAPIYVSTWAVFGGPKPTTGVDGVAIARAGAAGVLAHLHSVPADNTFVVTPGSGAVYRLAGGAPIYVSTWAIYGGGKATVSIDPAAVANAGRGGRWNHLAYSPANGTYLTASGNHQVFRVAGGAPLYVTSWVVMGGGRPSVLVDAAAISRARQPGHWSHLRRYPADGTFLLALPGGRVYRVAAGRAVYVPSWAPYGGPRPAVPITAATLARAGTGGPFNHLVR